VSVMYRYVKQCYRDSVSLMQFAKGFKTRGFDEVSAVMATAANLALLHESGLLAEVLEPRPDDLLLVLKGADLTAQDLADAEAELLKPSSPAGEAGDLREAPGSVAEAQSRNPALNFALISVPGDYAAAEGLKALAAGLHVMLFSDNVSVEREVFLKTEAGRRGLLLLGPDCGTSIVNGDPLGFANQVRRGPVGVVSASGTGLQEVTSLLDRWGSGVSQALGTGGRDLKEAVGGLTTLACLDLLQADAETKVVVLVSKPPSASVQALLLGRLAALGKPFVTCFVGDPQSLTLAQAAQKAFVLAEGRAPDSRESADLPPNPEPERCGGRWLRGLYSGGTLCAEAASLSARSLRTVASNVTVPGVSPLADPWSSVGNTFVDLGEDEFTRGRPHPMIDQSLRLDRFALEAADESVAAVVIDVVLGHGSHFDPATEWARFLEDLPVRSSGHRVPVFASVTGTDADPQGWSRSLATLRLGGVAAYGSNVEAVEAAVAFVSRSQELL